MTTKKEQAEHFSLQQKRLWLESIGVTPSFSCEKFSWQNSPQKTPQDSPEKPQESVQKSVRISQKTPSPVVHKKPPLEDAPEHPTPPTPDEPSWEQDALEAAKNAQTLAQLREAWGKYEHCALKNTARQLVFARGSSSSDVLILGEAPGREEDAKGLPFVGRSGRLLDAMLESAGIKEPYITNVVPWRPPGNRDPSALELAQCRPFVRKHVALVAPKRLLLLGRFAAQEMLQTEAPIGTLRGRWHDVICDEVSYVALVTYHPSYGLRNPRGKRQIWNDILTLADALDLHKNTKGAT